MSVLFSFNCGKVLLAMHPLARIVNPAWSLDWDGEWDWLRFTLSWWKIGGGQGLSLDGVPKNLFKDCFLQYLTWNWQLWNRFNIFSRRGWTTACLSQGGTVPVRTEVSLKTSFSNLVGTLSRQLVVDMLEMTLSNRSREIGRKILNDGVLLCGETTDKW